MKTLTLFFGILFLFQIAYTQSLTTSGNKGNSKQNEVLTAATELQLYPNPVLNDELNLKSSENFIDVEIVNVIGRTIVEQKLEQGTMETKILLSTCEKGIYLVKVTFANQKVISKKIIVK